MKPTQERTTLATYPSKVEVPARTSDVDMFRHLNNVAIGQFYEEARFALIGEIRERIARERRSALVIVNVDMAYIREARYPGIVTVGTGIMTDGAATYH